MGTERDPKTGRFISGASGNPSGRPAGRENNKTLLERLMGERHNIRLNGVLREWSTLELLADAVLKLAIKGDPAGIKLYQRLAGHVRPSINNDGRGGFLVVPEELSVEDYCKKMEEISKTMQQPIIKV